MYKQISSDVCYWMALQHGEAFVLFFLQNGLYSCVPEEGGQWEFKSTGCCSSIQLAGRLEGLQVT